MSEKRFRVQEHCLRSSYGIEAENWLVTNDNHSVVLNNKEEAHMVANMSNDVINKLNALHEENKELKEEKELLKNKLDRIEDILPHYLSCGEISEFHGKTYEEDIALMKCWNKRYQK